MGQYTNFYGKLGFTRSLNCHELGLLEQVIEAPSEYSSRICGTYIDSHFSTWDSDRDNARMHEECVRAMESDGLIVTDGYDYACDMSISPAKDGLIYTSEKSYDLVSGVNFIIANARARISHFGLRGSVFASTEVEPYHWLLMINDDGWAEQVPCGMMAVLRHNRRAFIEYFRSNWRLPPTC